MTNQIPKITQEFMSYIKEQAKKGIVRYQINNIQIDVFPYVFPPDSPFSDSSHTIYDQIGDLSGKTVLDIGTGTGIQAIIAAKNGAKSVDAVDISEDAISCAIHNVQFNKLEDKISVYYSDMFSNIKSKYDVIIANLPILDMEFPDERFYSLFDPKFQYHKVLFQEALNFLNKGGVITLCHADLKNSNDFVKLEKLAEDNGYRVKIKQTIHANGHEWRNYEFSIKR